MLEDDSLTSRSWHLRELPADTVELNLSNYEALGLGGTRLILQLIKWLAIYMLELRRDKTN